MKWLRRLLAFLLLLAVAFVVSWRLWGDRVEEWGRAEVERRLGTALHVPIRLSGLRVSWLPPRVEIHDFEIGAARRALSVARAGAELRALASVRQVRIVVDVTASGVWTDPRAWPKQAETVPVSTRARQATALRVLITSLPFRVRRLNVSGLSVVVPHGDATTEIVADRVRGSAYSRPLHRSVRYSLRAERVAVRGAGQTLRIEVARARGQLVGGHLLVRTLSVHSEGASVTGTGVQRGGHLQHRIRGDIRLASLGFLGRQMAQVGGRIEGDGTLDGPLSDWSYKARVRWLAASVDDRELGDIEGNLEGQRERLEVVSFRWRGFGATVDGRGKATLSASVPFRVEISGVQIDPQRLPRLAGQELLAGLNVEGELGVNGTLSPLAIQGDGKGRMVTRGDAPGADWALRGEYDGKIAALELGLDQQAVNTAGLDLTLSEGARIAGDVTARFTDTGRIAGLLGLREIPTVRGSMQVKGRLDGTLDRPELQATVNGSRVQFAGVTLDAVNGTVTLDRERLRVDELRGSFGGGGIEAQGTVAFTSEGQNDISASVHDVAVDSILALAKGASGFRPTLSAGRVSGTMSARGGWSRAAVTAQVAVTGFRLQEEPFERLDASVEAHLPQWRVVVDLVHRKRETMHGELAGTGTNEIEVSLTSTEWKLAGLRALSLGGLGGAISLEGHLQGRPSALQGRVELHGKDIGWDQRPVGPVTLTVDAQGGVWSGRAALLGEKIRLEGRVTQANGMPFELKAAWDEAPLSLLIGLDPDVGVSSTGSLQVHGLLGRLADSGGEMHVESLNVSAGGARLSTVRPIRVHMGDRHWTIESMALEGEGAHIDVAGGGGLGGEGRLAISGEGPLALAEIATSVVRSARGRFRVSLDAQRSANGDIALSGNAFLDDAAVDTGLPIVPTNVQGRFSLSGTEVRVERLGGRANGGTFEIGGALDVWRGPDLTWKVDKISTGFLEGAEAVASGVGSVTGTWQTPTVSGEVEIERFLYDQNVALTDLIPWFKRALAPPRERRASGRKVNIDLHVTAPDDLFIENNVARAEMRADIRARGDTADLELSGTIEVLSGEVKFRGRKFTVTSGVIEFRPELGLDPVLNFTAEATVSTRGDTYTVAVELVGTAEDHRVSLSSDDPGLLQTDLVSLVALGKTGAELQEAGGGISAGDVLGIGTGLYTPGAEGTLGGVLPVDRIQIEPTFSSVTGAFEPRVSVGKDFTEDLSALATQAIGADSRRSVELEYRFLPQLSLIGSWESQTSGEAGAFGGRFKFVYPFLHLPRWSLLRYLDGGARENQR
jgi:autotransporter translocation and assembly factor TamB